MDKWESEIDQMPQSQTNIDLTTNQLSKLEAVRLFKESYDRAITVYRYVHDPLKHYYEYSQELNDLTKSHQDRLSVQ